MNQRNHRRENIPGYGSLEELAFDLIWSWDHKADKIWRALDPELWGLTRNPLVVLQTISNEKLKAVLADPSIAKVIADLRQDDERLHAEKSTWFLTNYGKNRLAAVAYFSMEFMLSESLPIYSGGLGNVAGDQLKAVNDLGVPVVGVGLLYQRGYFRQIIDKQGAQQALYPYNSPEQLPIKPVRLPNGEWLRVEIALPGWKLWLRAWEVKVGRTKLYLLDSNDPANYAPHRGITSELYGGGSELRLKQEIVLGIGGWRLLEALGIEPEVCHLNEGHPAFAVLERAGRFRQKNGVSFEVALAATRAGNLFTTHTAVPVSFDRFDPSLVQEYLEFYANEYLGLSMQELLALGRENPSDAKESFNMAYLAIRGSGAVNGVSRLHGSVSRQIFSPLFPQFPVQEVPVGYVTNGVHVRSWDCAKADELWTQACGKCRWMGETEELEKKIRAVPDAKIWQMRNDARKEMIEFGRAQLERVFQSRGLTAAEIERARGQFNINTLTLGFAKRFTAYKRPNMLLHDPERLARILINQERPVQLVIAGKAHPADRAGQKLIKQWMKFIWRPDIRSHAIFVGDYDMSVTERLVGGVDLWLNTSRRPWEACGTSGMKVLVNGGLNLSELDGWWAEAYAPEVGWAIGDGKEHGESWDAREANQLYDLLENEIIPAFYRRNKEGIPTEWVARVKESMARLTPRFSANRAVREYLEQYYLPAAENYRKRAANGAGLAKQIVDWKHAVEHNWSNLQFGDLTVQEQGGQYLFEVGLYLDGLDPKAVKVELFASDAVQEMARVKQMDKSTYLYAAKIKAGRPLASFTPRAIPLFPGVSTPLEATQIIWQK